MVTTFYPDLDLGTASASQGSLTLTSYYTALVLPTASLSSVSSPLIFTLSVYAFDISGPVVTSNSITVHVNSPPTPGHITVTPTVGRALLDRFTLSASLWTDENTPITNRFSFLSSTGEKLAVGDQSVRSYKTTLLPAGQSTSVHAVLCFVEVYDSLGASSSSFTSVKVTAAGSLTSSLLRIQVFMHN